MRHEILMEIEILKAKLENALGILFDKDSYLLEIDVHERTITHRLAMYLQNEFVDWNVDCEYNRLGQRQPKAIPSQDTSYPDIIIHHRNQQDNLLVIEAKSIHSDDHSDTHDKNKIKAYIKDDDYRYQFGLWICFYDELAETQLLWFKNKDGVCQKVAI